MWDFYLGYVSGAHIFKNLFFDHQFSDKNIHDFLIENHCLKLENHFLFDILL
jgi:hypothetical protein